MRRADWVIAFAFLFILGAMVSGWHPHDLGLGRDHAGVPVVYPSTPATPYAGVERYVLQTWLPTMLEAPYGATAICKSGSAPDAWRCTVTQTALAKPLPEDQQPVWKLRVVGTYSSGYQTSILQTYILGTKVDTG